MSEKWHGGKGDRNRVTNKENFRNNLTVCGPYAASIHLKKRSTATLGHDLSLEEESFIRAPCPDRGGEIYF